MTNLIFERGTRTFKLRRLLAWHCLLCLFILGLSSVGISQAKPPKKKITGFEIEESVPKGDANRAIPIPKVKYVPVPSNKGYLAIFTVPQAKVVITQLLGASEAGKSQPAATTDKDGLVTFPSLDPGKYRIDITCKDYEPFQDTVSIQKGRQTGRIATLTSKFATLRIGLAKQASDDVIVKRNGQVFDKPKIEAGQLVFDRVPVGKQTFTVSKPGFVDWTQELDI